MAYDWLLIKREYIEGYQDENGQTICPTLDELAERHGCSYSTLTKRSSTENWTQERKLFGKKRETKTQEKKIEILATESANIDNKALIIADKGLEKVNKRIEDEELSHHDLMKLSNTASVFHKMGKLALGEPTEHIAKSGNISNEIKSLDPKTATIAAELAARIDKKNNKPS